MGVLAGVQAAGAIASMIGGASQNTTAAKQYYGGSKEESDKLKAAQNAGIDKGMDGASSGMDHLGAMFDPGMKQAAKGSALMDRYINQPVSFDQRGEQAIQAMDPSAVAQAQANAALDSAAHRNLGMAASGGAAGMRNALMANADAAVQASTNAAATGAQLAYQKQTQLADEYARQNQIQVMQRGQNLDTANMGMALQNSGNNLALQASTNQGNLGLGMQGQYLNAQTSQNNAQLSSDTEIAKANAAAAAAKGSNLMSMGGSLAGSAGKLLGMG